jgi:phage baseplate assembly protein W
MAKAFSIEDGNLSNKPITTTKSRTYKDIDCSFEKKLTSGDIYKKTDADAVKQSVRNLLLTNKGEKPFQPYFGSRLQRLMFSLDMETDESDVEDIVREAIKNYEPRATVLKVKANFSPDYNSANVTVFLRIRNTMQDVSVTVTIARVR